MTLKLIKKTLPSGKIIYLVERDSHELDHTVRYTETEGNEVLDEIKAHEQGTTRETLRIETF